MFKGLQMNWFTFIKESFTKSKPQNSQDKTLNPFNTNSIDKINTKIIDRLINGDLLFSCARNPIVFKTHIYKIINNT